MRVSLRVNVINHASHESLQPTINVSKGVWKCEKTRKDCSSHVEIKSNLIKLNDFPNFPSFDMWYKIFYFRIVWERKKRANKRKENFICLIDFPPFSNQQNQTHGSRWLKISLTLTIWVVTMIFFPTQLNKRRKEKLTSFLAHVGEREKIEISFNSSFRPITKM